MAALLAFLVFLAWFTAGSLTSDSMRFPYGYISAGGLALFLFAGMVIGRGKQAPAAAITTALAAFFATLGAWLILTRFNLVQAPIPAPHTEAMLEVVAFMTVAALLLGFAGAWLTGRSRKSS